MPRADQLLSWASGRQVALPAYFGLLVGGVLALNVAGIYLPAWLPVRLASQFDLAGLVTAGVGVASALVATFRAMRSRGTERLVWAAIAIGCLDIALVDLLIDRPERALYVPAVVLLAGSCFWALRRRPQMSRNTGLLLIAAAILAISNPIVDRYEVALAGDPDNYVFVSAGEPYRMTPSAWQRLSLVRQGQEASEAILVVLVFQLLLRDLPGSQE